MGGFGVTQEPKKRGRTPGKITASLNEKLRRVEWGEFRMGDLFERVKTNKLPYKAEDLPKQATEDYILPCLTSSFQNQGLNYFAPKEGATVLSHVISLPSNSDVYRAYYQSREFTVLSDAYAIRWKSTNRVISPNQYLFMVMCINKVTDLPIYSYKNKLGGWNVVQHKYIQLPIKNGDIRNNPVYLLVETGFLYIFFLRITLFSPDIPILNYKVLLQLLLLWIYHMKHSQELCCNIPLFALGPYTD